MEIQGKKVLIVGMARSGVAAAKTLVQLGAHVTINDMKTEQALQDGLEGLKSLSLQRCLGESAEKLIEGKDLVVISPSVPIESAFILKAKELGIEVISELELGYRLSDAPVIAITGTNGKTTTTALMGEIFKNAGINRHVVGNIGIPFSGKALDIAAEDVIIAEVSSFQLEAIIDFHPKISAILNIAEDHLNRHKTMENYIRMKARIFENQQNGDFIILNRDDEITVTLARDTKANVVFFSRKMRLETGAFVDDSHVVFRMDGKSQIICHIEEIRIPGSFNLENALAAVAMAGVYGIPTEAIRHSLKTFPGVEHRLEYVDEIDGIRFINDSKGTNPDSSIKAIEEMKGPTLLIAGGMDKGSDFSSFIKVFDRKIIAMIVLGETADQLQKQAYELGFMNVHKVAGIKEAVDTAYRLAKPGYTVLLSPACASWDMFKDFEERGRIFKDAVFSLRRV